MKIALVHDYLNQYGGAERVLEALSEIWPEAPIYTLVYEPKMMRGAFENKIIHTSFLQKFSLARRYHRSFLFMMPMAVERFDLSDYDVVISDSASYAKGVITKPKTLHICYCHTPTRYLWDDCHKYAREFSYNPLIKKIVPFFLNYLRLWDEAASARVDKFIANSNYVARRIKKYYSRDSEVIYPPVGTFISPSPCKQGEGWGEGSPLNYYLMVSRLLSYKKIDLAIEAFNQLNLPLTIVGDGRERKNLKKIAEQNIKFIGAVGDEELKKYYRDCRALIFPQEEDFGITAVEAMAHGKPVIAYRAGGALETIIDGQTGLFFDEQTPESLIGAIKQFEKISFNPQIIEKQAGRFDKEIFKTKIRDFVEDSWREFKK